MKVNDIYKNISPLFPADNERQRLCIIRSFDKKTVTISAITDETAADADRVPEFLTSTFKIPLAEFRKVCLYCGNADGDARTN